jgi:putative heme-binding domain-containing protein
LRRALYANLRVGTPAAAERLLTLALDAAASTAARTEAHAALRLWATPPRLDPFDGWARSLRPEPITAVLTPRLDALLGLEDSALRTRAIEIIIAHGLRPGAARVAAMVADVNAAPGLRAQALRLLAGEVDSGPDARRALDLALAAGSPGPLFRAALELLPRLAPERIVTVAREAWTARPVPERQPAIAAIAALATPAADALLEEWAAELAAERVEGGVRLELLEALRARSAVRPALAAHLDAHAATAGARARQELLAGGDVARGRDLAANHLAANCTACHNFESSTGSEVGPALRAIGSQRDPAYLLESLLQPSARIAEGYGIVNVTLRDGTEVTGTLAAESATEVTVRLFDGQRRRIPLAEVSARTPPVSIMPPMEGVLQPRELRDLVAYLASLKGGRGGRSGAGRGPGE